MAEIDNEKIANDLAFIGSINDQILNLTELSLKFIESVKNDYAGIFTSRYDIEETDDGVTMLGDIAIARGCLKKGGEPDYDKAAALIFDDFRSVNWEKFLLRNRRITFHDKSRKT